MARPRQTMEVPTDELRDTIEARAEELAMERALSGEVETESTDADEIRALSELDAAGEVRWNVVQTSPANQAGWVGVLSTAELSLETLAREFGVGRYRIKGSRPNGSFAGQRTVTISKVPRHLLPPTVNGVPTQPANTMADMLAMIEAQNARRSQQMKEWAGILIPALAPIIANMVGNKGPSLADLTSTLANMKQLSGGESQLSKIEEFSKMIEAVKGLMPEQGNTGSTWVDIVRDGIKEVGPVIGGLAAGRIPGLMPPAGQTVTTTGLAVSPAPSLPTVQIPPPNPSPVQGDPMLAMLAWFKEQLAGLAHQASMNKDPSLYAEVVLDNLPPGVPPTLLRDQLKREDWWSVLTGFFPGVQPYPQWFAECRAELLKGLDDMITATEPKPAPMPHDTDATDE